MTVTCSSTQVDKQNETYSGINVRRVLRYAQEWLLAAGPVPRVMNVMVFLAELDGNQSCKTKNPPVTHSITLKFHAYL